MPKGKPNSTPEERFLQRCIKQPCKMPNLTDCWIWTGGTYSNGYGQVKSQTYNTRYAHQYACSHWNNSPLPIPVGFCVKHKCDTKLCINPEHLEYGTIQENIQEMVDRNEFAMGRIPATDEELILLKELIEKDTPMREISRNMNCSRSRIARIIRDYLTVEQ